MPLPKPSILFINRCYWPDSEATGQLLTDLARDLCDQFEVHVVCGQPNSPTTNDFTRVGIEKVDGVTIHRLQHTTFAKRVPAGRLINLLSFTRAANRYLKSSRPMTDVVISETDPFLLPIVGAKHAERIGKPHVSYLQDIYPDVAEAIGKAKKGWLTSQIRSKLRSAYQCSDRVIVLGRCMLDRLTSEPWTLDKRSLRVIPNWADCESVRPLESALANPFVEQHALEEKFVLMHSGNMGLTQCLDVLIDATKQSAWPANAVLMLVGDGAAKSQLIEHSGPADSDQNPNSDQVKGSDRVRFLPYQPREKLAESLSAADLHVVSMHPNITGCLCPSKLYGILAAGRPALAIGDSKTDLCQTVNEFDIGWTVEPGSPKLIAESVARAASEVEACVAMGNRARQIALRHFDRPVVFKQFRDLLMEVIGM